MLYPLSYSREARQCSKEAGPAREWTQGASLDELHGIAQVSGM
jgi:hypothetical protein